MLTLTVTNPSSHDLGFERTRVFDDRGGTIGRASPSDWILPDPDNTISRHHAEIVSRNGEYWIIDHSGNGTFLNDANEPIGKGHEQPLRDGSRLRIGDYEISVTLEEDDFLVPHRRSAPDRHLDDFAQSAVRADDIIDQFPDRSSMPREPSRWPSEPDDVPPHREVFQAPPIEPHGAPPEPPREPAAAATAPPFIPGDLVERARRQKMGLAPTEPQEEVAPARREPEPEPPPVRRPKPDVAPSSSPRPARPTSSTRVTELLLAGGLDPHTAQAAGADPTVSDALGRGLNVVIKCLMDTLKARSRIKSEFKLERTEYKADSNNPLKFSNTAEEALQRMVAKDTAYLGPEDAFAEAAQDIRAHQVAMLAGMRAAFHSMMSGFDPDRLEARYDRVAEKAALIKKLGKQRYWDMYRQHFADMTKDVDRNFQELFGREFARAYEEQMKRHTERRR